MDGAYIALRGYKYQFDKTILEVFANPTAIIRVEQVQDYGFDDYEVQVKYHNTDYTLAEQKAKTKKPVLQLIQNFVADSSKRYVLYIYLKGVSPGCITFKTPVELESIIGKKTGHSASVLNAFLQKFTIIYADDFESNYSKLIDVIKATYAKSQEEAEIYYAIISSYLLDIVNRNPPSNTLDRTTSKADIDRLISSGKKIIFNSSYLEELGKAKYFKYLKKLYFNTSLNTLPLERFFIIETDDNAEVHQLKDILLTIKQKWSKNKLKSTPDADRFCPYLHFKGIGDDTLKQLKIDLQFDGYVIRDGFDFFNAPFNVASIKEKPNLLNNIQFKIINTSEQLHQLLDSQARSKEIYQFFKNSPLQISTDTKHIKIEITDLNHVKEIV